MIVSIPQKPRLLDYYANIHKKYDIVNRIFTFGRDVVWRAEASVECLKDNPAQILDVCCGTGDMTMSVGAFAKAGISVTGYDFSAPMLKVAQRKSTIFCRDKIRFVQGDVAHIPFGDCTIDCIAIAFGIRNLAFESPLAISRIAEMCRILKQDGKMVVLESGVPSSRIIKLFHSLFLYLFLVPLGGLITGDFKAYFYLARSSGRFNTLVEIGKILEEKGLTVTMVKKYFLGAANLIVARKN